ncbi:MAG: glycosyltransferase family 2 protein [Thermomicrobiales bacterium]
MTRLSVIMPCCNEEDAIELLPARLFPALELLARRYALELICVDDGSADATWERLTALQQTAPWPVVLARHQPNRGLGAALRTGQAHATGEIVVMLDADGTYPFTIVEPLVAALERGADIATASPYHRDGGVAGVSGLRLFFSRGASLCYRLLVDRRIATYTAMVRAYRASILAAALPEETGFLHVAMTLVEARRRGARIVEIPAVLARREVGVSKAKIARITRAHLRYMRRLLLLRATGRFWLAPRAAHAAETLEAVRHG